MIKTIYDNPRLQTNMLYFRDMDEFIQICERYKKSRYLFAKKLLHQSLTKHHFDVAKSCRNWKLLEYINESRLYNSDKLITCWCVAEILDDLGIQVICTLTYAPNTFSSALIEDLNLEVMV